jgi:hypothetical protein
MANRVDPHDPSTFPAPHTYATYISWRSEKFKTHSTLGMAKNAISGTARHERSGRRTQCDVYVYTWNPEDDCWEQKYFIPKHADLDQHELYKVKASSKRPIKGPSDKQVNAAIESIMKATQAEEV